MVITCGVKNCLSTDHKNPLLKAATLPAKEKKIANNNSGGEQDREGKRPMVVKWGEATLRSSPLDNIQHALSPSPSCFLSSLTHACSPTPCKEQILSCAFQRLPSPITFPKGGREWKRERGCILDSTEQSTRQVNASIRQLKLRVLLVVGDPTCFFSREVCLDLALNPVRTHAASFEVWWWWWETVYIYVPP